MMNHITYHYLLNGSRISGNYLYDINHLPNKQLQNRVYKGYVDSKIEKMNEWLKQGKDVEFARLVLNLLNSQSDLKSKANAWFKLLYDRRGYESLLGKPYFGIWGIHTTPADLFGVMPTYKYRIKIDLDTIDPDLIIIRAGIGLDVKDRNSNRFFKYTEANWDRLCSMYSDSKWTSKAYPNGFIPRTVSGGVPDIMIFVPRLKIDKSNFEVYNS